MMRLSFPLFLGLAVIATVGASKKLERRDDEVADTEFNGEKVPPMPTLGGPTLDEDISKGNWLVEFFSPSCPHCRLFAPTWQTLYEFYYTSKPLGPQATQDNLNTFSRYYDFKFAKVDCQAFGDSCASKDVKNYPTVKLFRDGKEVKMSKGAKDLKAMSEFVEEQLEAIKPGSRPAEGLKLPKAGEHQVDKDAEPAGGAKDKDPASGSAAAAAHNAIAQEGASTSKNVPNAAPKSVSFTAETFQKLVTNTRNAWFIKFYAPWCGHCQALAPNWAEMARDVEGKLNVGEVNCDVEKRLCKDAGVRGYPTILFLRDGESVEYDGLRGVGDLISYANKAVEVGTGIKEVDFDSFVKLEETEEVIFVYFYDHATTSEDFMAIDRLTLSLVGHARLVKTNDPKLFDRFKISTWPRLMVSRDGKPSYFSPLAPKDIRDKNRIRDWMRSVWLPIVPELTSSNAREVMNGRLVVLGILSRSRSDEFIIAKREIKNAALEWIDKQTQMFQLERQELRDAKQLRIEEAEDRNDQRALRNAKSIRINMDEIERKDVGFAWVDGVFWERWIRTTYGIDVKDGERVVINDEDNHHYYDLTVNGDPIRPSRTSILETLRTLTSANPKLTPKSTTSRIEHLFFVARTSVGAHPFLSALAILAVATAAYAARRSARRGRAFGQGGFLTLNEKEGVFGGGAAQGGKND